MASELVVARGRISPPHAQWRDSALNAARASLPAIDPAAPLRPEPTAQERTDVPLHHLRLLRRAVAVGAVCDRAGRAGQRDRESSVLDGGVVVRPRRSAPTARPAPRVLAATETSGAPRRPPLRGPRRPTTPGRRRTSSNPVAVVPVRRDAAHRVAPAARPAAPRLIPTQRGAGPAPDRHADRRRAPQPPPHAGACRGRRARPRRARARAGQRRRARPRAGRAGPCWLYGTGGLSVDAAVAFLAAAASVGIAVMIRTPRGPSAASPAPSQAARALPLGAAAGWVCTPRRRSSSHVDPFRRHPRPHDGVARTVGPAPGARAVTIRTWRSPSPPPCAAPRGSAGCSGATGCAATGPRPSGRAA